MVFSTKDLTQISALKESREKLNRTVIPKDMTTDEMFKKERENKVRSSKSVSAIQDFAEGQENYQVVREGTLLEEIKERETRASLIDPDYLQE